MSGVSSPHVYSRDFNFPTFGIEFAGHTIIFKLAYFCAECPYCSTKHYKYNSALHYVHFKPLLSFLMICFISDILQIKFT